jgi:hypothetical protein
MDTACSTWAIWKMHIEFFLESLKGKDHKEDLGVEGGKY